MAKSTYGYELECFGLYAHEIQTAINSVEGAVMLRRTPELARFINDSSNDDLDNTHLFTGEGIEDNGLFGYYEAKKLTLRCKENDSEMYWVASRDGSISNTAGRGEGHEIIAPLLYGVEGLLLASRVMKALVRAGARVNKSCGTHITTGVKNCNARVRRMSLKKQTKSVGKIVDAYLYFHNVFDTQVSSSRREGSPSMASPFYCPRPRQTQMYAVGTETHYTGVINRGVGRGTVNVAHFISRGIIEFRQHNGSLNGLKLQSFTQLLQKLISWAITDSGEHYGKDLRNFPPTLDGLCEMLGIGSDLRTTLEARARATRGYVNESHNTNMITAHRAFIGGISQD